MKQGVSRRLFLGSGVAGWGMAAYGELAAGPHDDAAPPSERIGVGIVGLGSRGFNLLDAFLNDGGARVVALCDVDKLHYRDRPWGQGTALGLDSARQRVEQSYADRSGRSDYRSVTTHHDYRELCAREDVDAVVVATPDHWHALVTLEALRHGKDVYCEKPLTHFFAEGQEVYREVAGRKAVFQAGSQQRSMPRFRRAVELVRNGRLGDVTRVEVGLFPGYESPMGSAEIEDPPPHLDYDPWCGPAPVLPYMRARHHRWWRGNSAYGGGVLMDWIGHHNDIAHWSLGVDKSGPTRVEAVGWTFPETPVYDTPRDYEIQCVYPGGIRTSISSRHRAGVRWIGTEGWVFADRGVLEASDSACLKVDFDPGPEKVKVSDNHVRDFLEGVKERGNCIAPAETAHRSVTPGHLGYVSNALGKPLDWDASVEEVVGDAQANLLLKQVTYRQGWG